MAIPLSSPFSLRILIVFFLLFNLKFCLIGQVCPESLPLPGCDGNETLNERSSISGVIDNLRNMESRIRTKYNIPSPRGWSNGERRGGRRDITKFRPTNHDDDISTPNETANTLIAVDIIRHLRDYETVARQFERVLGAIAESGSGDPALTLSIAYREASGSLFSTSTNVVNSLARGGLDQFGGELSTMRENAICNLGDNWIPLSPGTNESGPAQAANIPKRELLAAYDARVKMVSIQTIETLQRHGFNISNVNREAMRIAISVAFANNRILGTEYNHLEHRDDPPSVGFSLETLVTWMKSRIERGLASDFNDVMNDDAIRRFDRIRAAIAAVATAEMIDRSLLKSNGGVDCPDSARELSQEDNIIFFQGEWTATQEALMEMWSEVYSSNPPQDVQGNMIVRFNLDSTGILTYDNLTLLFRRTPPVTLNGTMPFDWSINQSGFIKFVPESLDIEVNVLGISVPNTLITTGNTPAKAEYNIDEGMLKIWNFNAPIFFPKHWKK